jgi:hypothetical protein
VLAACSAEPELLGPALSAHAPCSSAGAVPLRAESLTRKPHSGGLRHGGAAHPHRLRGCQAAAGIHFTWRSAAAIQVHVSHHRTPTVLSSVMAFLTVLPPHRCCHSSLSSLSSLLLLHPPALPLLEPLLTGRRRPLVSSCGCMMSICSGGRMRSSCLCGRRNWVKSLAASG